MKNKKIIITMMVIITILLVTSILGVILKISNANILKSANKETVKTSEINEEEKINNENNKENNNTNDISNNNVDNNNTENNINNETNTQNLNTNEIQVNQTQANSNTEQLTTTHASQNSLIKAVSSRSEADREKRQTVYVSLTQNTQQDYEEIITYTKLEDVKISFNMDVSKTTGLSKEDFVSLVQKMKYDRTGILEKNAAWIWECCQKYNVNEIFVLGICGIESAWCSAPQHQNTHNYSSLMKGGKLIPYSSDEAGFEAMIKLLGQKYLSPKGSLYHGATITGVGTCYCNTTTWPKKVYTCMQQVFK